MKKLFLALVGVLFTSSALAQWQVPTNNIPFGRGSGTGFNSAQAAANSVLMTDGSMVPGLGQTLPTTVQNNITRVGTLVAGAVPFTLLTGRATFAQLPAGTAASVIVRTTGAGDFSELVCTSSQVPRNSGGTMQCSTLTDTNISSSAAIAYSKLVALSANQLLGALTATTPSGLTVPSCSAALNGLAWTSGVGFSCNTYPSVSTTYTTDRYLKGNGSSWITSSGAASGVGSCGGGQFVTGLNSDAAPTCNTPAGGGNVSASGTPAVGQIGRWVTSTTIEGFSFNVTPQGRLTLTSGTPVLTSTTTAQTTVYYTPYVGDIVPLYDGTNVVPTVFSEISQATTDATKSPAAVANNSVYDIFVWNDSGTIRATRGPAWTNDTTRSAGTALVRVKGLLLNNAAITNGPAASRGTYVGTIRSNGSAQIDYNFGGSASGGTAAFFGVWNAYNRRRTVATVTDSGAGYAYATGTIRQARGSAGNQVSFVLGLQEDGVFATSVVNSYAVAQNAFVKTGLGFDSITAFPSGNAPFFSSPVAAGTNTFGTNTDTQTWFPSIGLHYVSSLEQGDGANNNQFNNGSNGRLNVELSN